MLTPENPEDVVLGIGDSKRLEESLLFGLQPIGGEDEIDRRLLIRALEPGLFDLVFDFHGKKKGEPEPPFPVY